MNELQDAIAEVLNQAYYLLDDTANDNPPEVPQDSWDNLSAAVEALEAIIPDDEQPCTIGVAARLLAAQAQPTPRGESGDKLCSVLNAQTAEDTGLYVNGTAVIAILEKNLSISTETIEKVYRALKDARTPSRGESGAREAVALREAIVLIDEINERKSSRAFYGIGQVLHAKLCTIRATLARAALSTPIPTGEGTCSFCGLPATTLVNDESDFMPACKVCKEQWQRNPGFAERSSSCDQAALERAWRDDWTECKNRLTEHDAWLDSETRGPALAETAGQTPIEVAGWQLVPVEPTADMTEAGNDIAIYHLDDIIQNQADPIWQAMLAAAPPPPSTGEREHPVKEA